MSGPAFPVEVGARPGLTKTQYFAGQALAGILANPEFAILPTEKVVEWAAEIGEMMQRRLE